MISEFDNITPDAKIFIYPSSNKLYPQQIEEIELLIHDFIQPWSDKHDITVSHTIKYNRFIVFAIENDKPIHTEIIDELVGFIFKLQTTYNTNLMDKLNVCFKQGEYVQYKEVKEFKKLIKNRGVNSNTIVFDNLITTKLEFDHYWELPAEETWYDRMF